MRQRRYVTGELPIGLALRRFRRLNMVKQSAVAEMLGVSQGCVSRWESGAHRPDAAQRDRIIQLISASVGNDHDAGLKRLIECSQRPVHLICDATHQLLAASRSRAASWRTDISELIGRSLCSFASPEIAAAEAGLFESGWFERPYQSLELRTESNGQPGGKSGAADAASNSALLLFASPSDDSFRSSPAEWDSKWRTVVDEWGYSGR